MTDRKLYLGPRLRVLRRELGLNQTQMAEELGVSPSYLNHLERNQRPVTAQMLLRLANTYDVDMRAFVAGANEAAASDLHEIFADALVRDIGIPRHEILEVAENYPSVAEAIGRLYRGLADLRQLPDRVAELGTGARITAPLDWLGETLVGRHNHLAELDSAAEAMSSEIGEGGDLLSRGMHHRLKERHGITVRVVPDGMMIDTLRHYDFHRKRYMVSERLAPASRDFGLAYQLAQLELADLIVQAVEKLRPPDADARMLARVAVTNYAAAAIVMPYGPFHAAAAKSRHDLDLLMARFGASYEQVAHRLTTLGRHGARGVPFFLLKVDDAGNVSKRFASKAMPLARYGGGCPRWGIARTFRLPGETIAVLAEAPDGQRYASVARAIPRTAGPGLVAIVLGCEARHADAIGYTDRIRGEPVPIGPACQLCERTHCSQRALPPITRALDLHPYQRPATPYPFRPT